LRTTKPISTVSYNTEEFLTGVLNDLIKAHKVAFWAFIRHTAEDDETKDHIHLYIEPNVKVDTMDLADLFREIDPKNPSKPFKCVDWRPSKWDDWYLYGIHDAAYLRMKFEERKYHYGLEDVRSSDADDLEIRAYRAMHSDVTKNVRIHEAMMNGMTADKMAFIGAIAPSQAFQMAAYQAMFQRGHHQIKMEAKALGFEPVDELDNPFYGESEGGR
jgi:hypothetical protein